MAPQAQTGSNEPAINISRAAPQLLKTLFMHHDGIVLGATIAALYKPGLLTWLWQEKRLSMREIRDRYPANPGYLHVALRALAQQGWLRRHGTLASDDLEYEVTGAGEIAAVTFATFAEVGGFVYSGVPMDDILFGGGSDDYAAIAARCRRGWDLPPDQGDPARRASYDVIRQQLDGLLFGPMMIAFKRRDLLEDDRFPLAGFPQPTENLLAALELLQHAGWVDPDAGDWRFTDLGRAACNFSLHYGLTLSYWPLYCRLSQLIFGTAKNVTHGEVGDEETHVDRVLNVLASGMAHRRYFEDSDAIILQIFNQEPLSQQPQFVADMGCGDGTWLQRIFEVVRDRTLRGRHLSDYPLTMIGADFNAKAVDVAESRLKDAGVPNLTLFGDITDPDQFAASLRSHGFDSRAGLHIRAFIDHNRQYARPVENELIERRPALSSGAYADPDGTAIPNRLMEQNLVEHLRKWTPHVGTHGLVVIEAHNVDPNIAAKYGGRIHSTAFDTYHGYSNQYPVDFEAFTAAAEDAGLSPILYQEKIYPSRLPFVAISINHFKLSDPDCLDRLGVLPEATTRGWRPEGTVSRADGEALHRYLYRDGDITKPALWCSAVTGILVRVALEAIEKRIAACLAMDPAERDITVLDFGAGTGLATVELVKGLDEKGLLKTMDRHGINFRLLLFDLPSDWFAKAYELLGRLPFVEFHSLRDPDSGGIRLVSDTMDHDSVDVVLASMVLHLIPPKVMPALFDSLADILKPGGAFVWTTPDTAPTPPEATVIHAANRILRETVTSLLDGAFSLTDLLATVPEADRAGYADLPAAIENLQNTVSREQRAEAKAAGAKQILPVPTEASVIHRALNKRFSGEPMTLVSVVREDELLDLALFSANQRFFGEIKDPDLRRRCTSLLLKYKVLPALGAGPAGHPAGFSLQWTYGTYINRE